ncbi:hypothetical protein QLX08_005376 [Tetragonisca angustula]|uniref:Secreted protein n=1 Tax=Tetragonisca angustula TaxID=166442 RepID=A0AAW0ZYS1_9HYME
MLLALALVIAGRRSPRRRELLQVCVAASKLQDGSSHGFLGWTGEWGGSEEARPKSSQGLWLEATTTGGRALLLHLSRRCSVDSSGTFPSTHASCN